MYKSHNIMSLLRDMKLMSHDRIFLSRDKSVDLTGILSCRATLFECLQPNLLSLRQVSSIWRHKPDLLLFRSIAGTGDLLSKPALSILWFILMHDSFQVQRILSCILLGFFFSVIQLYVFESLFLPKISGSAKLILIRKLASCEPEAKAKMTSHNWWL